MQNRVFEIIAGFTIIIISAFFLIYGVFSNFKQSSKTYKINAIFNNVGGLNEGSKIKVNGVVVGVVDSLELNQKDFSIFATFKIKSNIKIPKDSVVIISSSGIFESPSITLMPTKNNNYIQNGETLANTKDFVSLEDKIGNIFFNLNSK
jgi:phospholipid/cholesterol/gamma-HCH transport system substrate-binding protein